MWPGFVGVGFIFPFFNCVCKYASVCDDDHANSDELAVCFRIFVCFGHGGVLVDCVEDVCD